MKGLFKNFVTGRYLRSGGLKVAPKKNSQGICGYYYYYYFVCYTGGGHSTLGLCDMTIYNVARRQKTVDCFNIMIV